MTEPDGSAHFLGFAGRSVPEPGWEVLRVDEAAGMYGETRLFFFGIGQEHATGFVQELMHQQRAPEFQLAYDLNTAVRDFSPIAPYNLGGEFDRNAEDYAIGFVDELVEEANRIRLALDAEQRGQPYEPDYYPGNAEWLEGWKAQLALWRTDLSASDLLAVADQLDELARAVSANLDVSLPQRLQDADRRREQEVRDRAALGELTVAIDQYSALRALPHLVSPNTGARAAERDRLVARIAVLDTRDPHLIASLTDDRAQVVHDILPESATRERLWSWPDPLPLSPFDDHDQLRAVAAAANELTTRLVRPGTRTMPNPANQARVINLVETLASHLRQDPTLADHLPTLQAGLIRHLAAQRHARQQPQQHDLPGDANQLRDIGSTHMTSQPAASQPTRSRQHQIPGTPAVRHTAATNQQEIGRAR